ncbi:hypothetical protein [Saccharothrix sp.]|uniref:hypothetical protein n=1 Tax=Saccharothrix sp. TaxID=1873460 RepID=UPI0028117125|nr:hypothetical protein [Saccharothrix sp.]
MDLKRGNAWHGSGTVLALAATLLLPGALVAPQASALPAGSPAAVNGQLKVCGVKLCDLHGKPIQLRGTRRATGT